MGAWFLKPNLGHRRKKLHEHGLKNQDTDDWISRQDKVLMRATKKVKDHLAHPEHSVVVMVRAYGRRSKLSLTFRIRA